MSAASKPLERPMTVAEFLAYDDGTETRHELVNGVLVAMNPPATRHVQICENIGRALRPAVKGTLPSPLEQPRRCDQRRRRRHGANRT